MDKTFKIAGLGEVLWDAFPEGEKFGGAPANFACHCHSLGAEAYVLSAIGEDERGRLALSFLEEHGTDVSCLAVTPSHETGVVLVTLDESGKPEYQIKERVAWDNIPLTPAMQAIAPQLDAVSFGSLGQRADASRSTIMAVLGLTRTDCLRVFDINLRQAFYTDEILRASLEAANVLKLNDEELPVVARLIHADGPQEEQLKAILRHFDLKLAVLTCGAEGALMVTPTESCHAAAGHGPVASTVGAGDAFTAATVTGILFGRPLSEINAHANAVALHVCSKQGAVPELPESLLWA